MPNKIVTDQNNTAIFNSDFNQTINDRNKLFYDNSTVSKETITNKKIGLITSNLLVLVVIYCAILVLSNLTASKITNFYGLNFTAAILFFPFTYIIDDVITEVYGFQMSRKIIWIGLFCNIFVLSGATIIVNMPSSPHWNGQEAFESVFNTSNRILMASFCAYIVGEFVNSIILAKLKIYTEGKYFWFRAISSTIIGAIFDTSIFMLIAFVNVVPYSVIGEMIAVEYIIKIIIEVLVLPMTYSLSNYLKQTDQIDYYDIKTKFNIFSLKSV